MDFEVRHIDGTTVKLISSEHKCAITSATQTRKLCGNDTVTINLQSATYIDFYVGDKITIFGTTYTLNQLPTVKKESERSYSYTLVFEGLQYTLIDRVFLMPDNTQGDNLMFDLAGMLDVLDDNINRGNSGKQYVFELDESLEETEYKNLSLTGKNCLQVLQQLCQEWDTEFVFAEEPSRIAIYIGVAGSTFAFPFTYGRGGGVYELNREKGASDICTRLFVYGGTQNLTYYRHNRLCLPSKEKNQSYVEDATAQAVYGIKEQVKNFDDIYPNRIGTITSLSGCDYNEFIDSAMADSQYGFDLNEKWADNADDCEEWLALKGLEDTPENEAIYYNDVAGTATKYLMAGATAKIHINTGALAGYECDLHSYTHSSQKFVLKPLVDENGYDFPSKTNAAFKLAVGDEYVILDINLPTAYKTQAESKLATEAASYFETVCRPQPKYTLTIEPIALKHIVGPSTADTEIFKVGDLINISDPTGGVESATIRIDQFVRNLLDPFDYKLTLTDEITYSQQVRTLIEVDAIKRVVEESKIYDVNRIRRGWKDAEELYNQMFDTEGHYYSEKIAPLSIDTQMLKVGARSQQLVLQNVLFQPNYNANPANLQISAGSLVHYTIAEPDIKTWTMSALSASNLPSTTQYVYAKCAKNGTTGTWLVTDQAIIFDSDPSYYHFLVGSLSSVDSVSNTRNFAATYGFTTINGRNITTGVIKSSDGSSVVIDLDAGIIKGNITFEAGTTSYNALQDIISDNDTVQGAATTANTANAIANRAEGKIDGLEIGGRNLLLNSSFADNLTNWGGSGVTINTSLVCAQVDGSLNSTKNVNQVIDSHISGTETTIFTFSGEMAITSNATQGTTNCFVTPYFGGSRNGSWYGGTFKKFTLNGVEYNSSTYGNAVFDIKGQGFKKFIFSFEVASGATGNVYMYARDFTGTFYFRNLKLEKGNKATDWSPAPEDTEAELTAMQSDLQTQIDSKIETWSQVADPSTAWTTTALKDQHVGDLWYYTGETTNTRTNNKTYKYTKSGSTYSWTEHSAGGGDLFDKIDGKAAIWYGSTSDHPAQGETVNNGDFLVDGATGKTYKFAPTQTPNENGWVNVQDYQTPIATLDLRLDNIDSDTVFSVSEKENYRTDFEKIVGLGIPVAGYIPTAAELAEGSYNHGVTTYDCSKGTFYQHYSLIRATATNTLGALSQAYTNLRNFLVNVELYVNTDYGTPLTPFSRTALAELICAYLDAEKAIDLYASTVGTLTATTDTAESTQRKELTINTPEGVTSAMLSDMLVDEDMRMLIHFDNKLTTQSLYFGLPVIPNGVSGDTARFSYMGRTTAQQCKINVTGAEFVVKFSAKSSSYVTYIAESEQALQQDVMFSGAMALAGGVYGGLALLSLLVLRNAAGQQMAGMNGLDDSDLAFWAGGALEEALNNNVPVWIKRNGSARFGKLRFDNGRIYWQDGGTERFVIQDTVGLQTANRVFNPSNQNDNNTFDTLTNITITTINSTSSSSPTVATIQTLQALNNATAYTYYNGMDVYIEIQVSLYCTNSGTGGAMHVILQYTDNGSTWYDVPNAIWTWNLAPSTTGESQVFDPTVLSFVYNASSIPSSTGYKSAIGLRMAAWKDSGLTSVSFDTSGTKWHYYKDISKMRTAIGKNGFGVMLNANNLFSSFVNNNDSELTTTIKGNTDIPGVLWAGNISSGASVLPHYKNAAKYASSQLECDNWNSTNKYFRITHRLGTGNFTAMVTPTSSAVTARTTKDGTYLYVYLSAQASFDLVLFGTN